MMHLRPFILAFFIFALSSLLHAQQGKLFLSGDYWGNFNGHALYVYDEGKVYLTNQFGSFKEDCALIWTDNQILESADFFGNSFSRCLYIVSYEPFKLWYPWDTYGNRRGDCAAIIEENKIFLPRDPEGFAKGDCMYVIEDNKVFEAADPFGATTGSCKFILEGEFPAEVLVAVLLGTE